MIIIPEIKLTFKNLIKIIGVCCLLVIAGYFVVYWAIINMSDYDHRNEVELIQNEVENGLDYPKNFSSLIDKIRPSKRTMKSMYREKVFCTIAGGNHYPRRDGLGYTYYSEAVFEIINNEQLIKQKWTNLFDEKMLFAIGLENELSAKEIETYYFMNKTINLKVNENEYKRLTGLEEVALKRFGKNVEDLQQLELIELFVLMDVSGAFYQANEEKLKARIKMFERYLER
jgi:hypothetical protein